jgi:hypothetical protein
MALMMTAGARAGLAAVGVMVAVCAGCSAEETQQTASAPPSTTTAARLDCLVQPPGQSSIDGALADIPGFTVKEICPAEVDPIFGGLDINAQFYAVAAGDISQNDTTVLRVLAAQLKSDSGDAFVQHFMSGLSARTPAGAVASEPQEVGGHDVRYFNAPVQYSGYTYVNGPTVVITSIPIGADPELGEDAMTKILANLKPPS